MNLNKLKNPFEKVLTLQVSKLQKGKLLVRRYEQCKKKALSLSDGGYSIKKTGWLQMKLQTAQIQIQQQS